MEINLLKNEEQSLLSNKYTSKYNWKKIFLFSCIFLILLLIIIIPVSIYLSRKNQIKQNNIIFFIGDGMGPASITLARECGNRSKLTLDHYLIGTSKTRSASSLITDSAAGATAYSCALRTYNGAIAVDIHQKPCGTLLEAAKKKGMSTGLVVTSRISHATPAAFSSHVISRDLEETIAKQQIDNKVDVMFGGGLDVYIKRKDNLNLITYAENLGYNFIQTAEELEGPLLMPVIGLFANSHLPFEIDRKSKEQPSLAQMTKRALELLSQNEKGFFLMVEGSRIDMAGHLNDPTQYHETLAFDDAFQVAIDFSEKNENTFIVVTADHETGGLTLGRNFDNNTYPDYVWYPDIVRKIKASVELMENYINMGQPIRETILLNASIHLTSEEEQKIKNFINETNLAETIGDIISYRARIGWTTWGHTGVDVNIYANGYKAEKLKGNYKNVDLGLFISQEFDLNLAEITKELSNINVTNNHDIKNFENIYGGIHS
jgi:alkaline phosphatase